ncbi:MAG: glycine/sarcosine/betaine reductase selenoprotein B family protein [Hyphomicrobiaceae bacterium]
MVRLADLPEVEAQHLRDKPCPRFAGSPLVDGPPLRERRVAIVTTAGLHPRGAAAFALSDTGFRVIPGDTTGRDLVMSHTSVNFDRTGFQQDLNVVFPIDRLREAEARGEIASLAARHYSLMGALWEPHEIEPTARGLAGLLKQDRVDAVLLVPV